MTNKTIDPSTQKDFGTLGDRKWLPVDDPYKCTVFNWLVASSKISGELNVYLSPTTHSISSVLAFSALNNLTIRFLPQNALSAPIVSCLTTSGFNLTSFITVQFQGIEFANCQPVISLLAVQATNFLLIDCTFYHHYFLTSTYHASH